jgi:hypothetical protein
MSFTREDFFVSLKGGKVSYTADQGEVVFELPVKAGRISCADYVFPDYQPIVYDVVIVPPPSGVTILTTDHREDTGADREYVVSGAEKERRKIAAMVQKAADVAVQRYVDQQTASQVIEPTSPPPADPPPAAPAPVAPDASTAT